MVEGEEEESEEAKANGGERDFFFSPSLMSLFDSLSAKLLYIFFHFVILSSFSPSLLSSATLPFV